MNTPQFEQPARAGRRRIPKFVMLLIGLLIIAGIAAIGLPMFAKLNAAESAAESAKPATDAFVTALDGRLDRLEKMVRELTTKIAASNDTQIAIKSDIAAMREEFGAIQERLDKEAADRAAAKASIAQRAAIQRRRIAKVAPPPAPTAAVLSVDMWGGKPSVALRGPDGRVQFANTGDRVPGGGVIGAAQHKGQTVTIRQADGSVSTMTSKEMQQ